MRKALVIGSLLAATFGFQTRSSADDAAVARSFKAKCAACHGVDGKGKTKQGEKMKIGDLTSGPIKKELTAEKVKAAILDGITREKDGVKQEMKPLRGKIPDDQLDALVTYVLGLK